MRVTKAQAQANRGSIVEHASALFRERGFDGVGVADLMVAAGFTHGGFYNHFRSKADLIKEALACGLEQTAAAVGGADAAQFVQHYVSRAERDALKTGCSLSRLGSDTARQSEAVKTVFAEGIESILAAVRLPATPQKVARVSPRDDEDTVSDAERGELINLLAHSVGALVLSRGCPDNSALADEILHACREKLLAQLERGDFSVSTKALAA
ncbi:TetR family transcriptional regulator [Acidovorax sp. SUPP3334]|uniref:TetR/AcrR family transcriptional regulator n=1 Tax=Acidovorax sp. SUPP3334 TaxID=2920881 RepID=UPI0023DE4F8A|nr:TetR family transcriptional regulator [Acidovorax sp. SUPP3334]GKT20888.1 TetR family transcriptional regulator [Acidovorax sp. SUPP3334]